MGCACEGEMQRELRKPSGEISNFSIAYLDARRCRKLPVSLFLLEQ